MKKTLHGRMSRDKSVGESQPRWRTPSRRHGKSSNADLIVSPVNGNVSTPTTAEDEPTTPCGTDEDSQSLDKELGNPAHAERSAGRSACGEKTAETESPTHGSKNAVEADNNCEAEFLETADESSITPSRFHRIFSRQSKRKKGRRDADQTDVVVVAEAKHQAEPQKPKRLPFWASLKLKRSDSGRRQLGGGSKSNIEDVFIQLKSTAATRDCHLPSFVSPEEASTADQTTEPSFFAGDVPLKHLRSLSNFVSQMVKPQKVPRLELEKQKDWIVEYYKDHKEKLNISGATITQNLQVRSCEGITVQLENKVNNVIIESCKATNVILAGLISSVELVHCEKVKVQVLGNCPSVNMDNCIGMTLYVGKEGRSVTITSSRSADMNISFPVDDAEEDWVEVPIPQQFVHTINAKNGIDSKVSDLYR